ncbi:hypothetical protein [Candidatus Clostridium radicumherbarum]|uniref:Uncharacterized protein n=1 Tax=Candidatus Clostridium radicumherbarum TaxID=3381662 RepID=A0ABW8TTT1_9CLOT
MKDVNQISIFHQVWYNSLTEGVIFTKLICKCGNVEDIITDKPLESFQFRNCGDGTVALVCKKCSDIEYIINNG